MTLNTPSSVSDGVRPRMARTFAYSSAVRPNSRARDWLTAWVTASLSLGAAMRQTAIGHGQSGESGRHFGWDNSRQTGSPPASLLDPAAKFSRFSLISLLIRNEMNALTPAHQT